MKYLLLILIFLSGCVEKECPKCEKCVDPVVVEPAVEVPEVFNEYILKSIKLIDTKYRKLGYGKGRHTHDIDYGSKGIIPKTKGDLTMCVAAQMEIILEAMNIYKEETGKTDAHDFLPIDSWRKWRSDSIMPQIWVSHKLNSLGTSDALRNFGMGVSRVPFKDLKSGSFCNFDRTNRTGHATAFVDFIDKDGNVLIEYSDKVKGYLYYSSQTGGMDYRKAFFSGHCPKITGSVKRDCGIIKRSLICGYMTYPSKWRNKETMGLRSVIDIGREDFNIDKYNGITIDD